MHRPLDVAEDVRGDPIALGVHVLFFDEMLVGPDGSRWSTTRPPLFCLPRRFGDAQLFCDRQLDDLEAPRFPFFGDRFQRAINGKAAQAFHCFEPCVELSVLDEIRALQRLQEVAYGSGLPFDSLDAAPLTEAF